MKTGTKLFLIFGGIVLLIIVSTVGYMALVMLGLNPGTTKSRELHKKRTAETVGTITNVSLNTSSKEYTYTYVVNGVSYTATYTSGRSKVEDNYRDRVGKKGQVCYDPSDPSSSDFWNHEYFLDKGNKIVCGGTSQ